MSTRTHSQIKAALVRARTILADPAHWKKGYFRAALRGTRSHDPEDFAYCALGATKQACNRYGNDPLLERDDDLYVEASRALHQVALHKYGAYVDNVNDRDSTTHEEILCIFDKAIEQEARLAQQQNVQ